MATVNLSASPRSTTGKGVARKLRAAGQVPAVIYGHARQAQALVINAHELQLLLEKHPYQSTVIELGVDEQQQLHHVLGRRIRRLHDEDIGAAHVLIQPHEHFADGEARHGRLAEFRPEVRGDSPGERGIRRAGEHAKPMQGNSETVHEWRLEADSGQQGTGPRP